MTWSHRYRVSGDFWTGNPDASGLMGAPKPAVTGEPYDWEDAQHVVRAEMMTLVTDPARSVTEELTGTHDQDAMTRFSAISSTATTDRSLLLEASAETAAGHHWTGRAAGPDAVTR